jgi:hypothetical protein
MRKERYQPLDSLTKVLLKGAGFLLTLQPFRLLCRGEMKTVKVIITIIITGIK